MSSNTLSLADVRDLASGLGFCAIGATPATPEVLSIFPWARGCISAALSYLPSQDLLSPRKEPHACVALFASSQDYHNVLKDRLQLLSGRITANSTIHCAICVDTVPIPERFLALQAGTVWLGRNCCAFAPGAGSYCVLGEIITDLALPLDAQSLPSLCGDCTLCIKACPTSALRGDGTLDASRCISALTQAAGGIPPELRPYLKNQLYGCDICQEVCPHNQCALHSEAAFAVPAIPGRYPLLRPLLQLSASDFRTTLRGTSIGWIGRTRVRRNACVVAGNTRSHEAIPALSQIITEQTPILHEHANWALKVIESGYG